MYLKTIYYIDTPPVIKDNASLTLEDINQMSSKEVVSRLSDILLDLYPFSFSKNIPVDDNGVIEGWNPILNSEEQLRLCQVFELAFKYHKDGFDIYSPCDKPLMSFRKIDKAESNENHMQVSFEELKGVAAAKACLSLYCFYLQNKDEPQSLKAIQRLKDNLF